MQELRKLLEEFTALCGDDKEKLGYAERYAKDLDLMESCRALKGNAYYDKVIADLEQANSETKDKLLLVDLTLTSDNLIRQVIADYQANMRTVNTLKGPAYDDVKKQLERSVATLKEEAELDKDNEK